MTELASAVVVNWMRPGNIPRIVESLREVPWIDDIVCWDNSPDGLDVATLGPGVTVCGTRTNQKLWGRFRAARDFAAHEWIATVDDDYTVNNWQRIYDEAMAHPQQITACMFFEAPQFEKQQIRCGKGWDIMLGWGSMFRRSWIEGSFRPYVAEWGLDDVLLAQADRIFCVMQGREHNMIEQDVTKLEGVDGPMAMHKDKRHKAIVRLARKRAAELLERSG